MTRAEAEAGCVDLLMAGRVSDACAIVAQFEVDQGRQFDAAAGERLLALIFTARPRILRGVTLSELQILRIGAAMMELWGTNRCKKWLPVGFHVNLAIDADAAARMVLFSAEWRGNTEDYREGGISEVEWSSAPDACPACIAFAGKRFRTDAPPELPYEHCTHRMGCRCLLLPFVRFERESPS